METNTETTSSGPAPKAPKKAAAKKATKKAKLVKKASKVAKTEDGKTPLKAICAKLDIEPRLARRKLRNADLGFHDHRDRWNFTEAQAKKVTELLRA